MKIKQNHLLKICLYLEYYKECITDRYGVMLTDFLVDNDVLDNLTKRLYITTLDKQIKMEQENKQLKENWSKLKKYNNKCINKLDTWLDRSTTEKAKLRTYKEIKNKMQELEQGSDSNE